MHDSWKFPNAAAQLGPTHCARFKIRAFACGLHASKEPGVDRRVLVEAHVIIMHLVTSGLPKRLEHWNTHDSNQERDCCEAQCLRDDHAVFDFRFQLRSIAGSDMQNVDQHPCTCSQSDEAPDPDQAKDRNFETRIPGPLIPVAKSKIALVVAAARCGKNKVAPTAL